MPQIHELTAAEIARQIRDRTITPIKVVQALLARMDALEPQLEAWVRVDRETVLADAQQRQAEMDIGAETAEEIALSILGEIQAVLTGRQGGKLRDHTGPIHDRPA